MMNPFSREGNTTLKEESTNERNHIFSLFHFSESYGIIRGRNQFHCFRGEDLHFNPVILCACIHFSRITAHEFPLQFTAYAGQ